MKTWDEMTPLEAYEATQEVARIRCKPFMVDTWGAPFWFGHLPASWFTICTSQGMVELPTRNGGH